MFQLKPLAALIIGSTLALAGCGQYNKLTEIGQENSLLRFYGKAHKGITPERVAYADPWEYEEYAGFTKGDIRLEMFYVTAATDRTSIEYPYSLRNMADTWRYNSGKSKTWGEGDSVKNPMTEIEYQRFTQAGETCASFNAGWDVISEDPSIRPSRVLFGYLCANKNANLTDEQLEDTLQNIGIRGLTEQVRKGDTLQIASGFGQKNNIPLATQNDALALAKGSGSGAQSTGNMDFPFEFAITFQNHGENIIN